MTPQDAKIAARAYAAQYVEAQILQPIIVRWLLGKRLSRQERRAVNLETVDDPDLHEVNLKPHTEH